MTTRKPRPLTPAMLRELRNMDTLDGAPTDPFDWHHAPAGLWFHARDKVIGALLARGLIVDEGEFRITDAGRAALAGAKSAA